MKPQSPVVAVIGFIIYAFLTPAILFIAAGTLRWPMAWAYTIAFLLSVIGSRAVVFFKNPDTLQERANFTSAENIAPWDRFLASYVGLLGPAIVLLVAGLDYRNHWSAHLPEWLHYIGAGLVLIGYLSAIWAMIANRYFSSVARIQKDRGHAVVSHGPYHLVRHPAYAGAILAGLAIPLMLNTLWAYIPTVVLIATLVLRTHLEDILLQENLEGYQAYTQQTRYRIFPGIW
jgi:protein-S-isoprenylcysteine O-methyltransferase Ste14